MRKDTDADKVKEAFASHELLQRKLTRYNEILQQHPHGVSSIAYPGDYADAASLHDDILSEMGHLHDLNRLSDKDLELFRGQLPDITSKYVFSAGPAGGLAAVARAIHDKFVSTNNQYLNLPRIQ